jgi:hypothetical protein
MKHHKTNRNAAAAAITHHKPTSKQTDPTSDVEGDKRQERPLQEPSPAGNSDPASGDGSTTKGRLDDSFVRNGKIARLPAEIREALNVQLEKGVSGTELLRWLNSLNGTQAVLKEHFNGQPVSQQNLSQWRLGGFRDWLLRKQAEEVLGEFVQSNPQLAETMGWDWTDKLAL